MRLLKLEFLLLCIVLPGIIIWGRYAHWMFGFLWAATVYCVIIARKLHPDLLKTSWNWQAVTWVNLKPILLRWVLASVAMYGFLIWYDPARLFGIWHQRPEIIPILLVFYPIVSALPQEWIFCTYFFWRYQPLFGTGQRMLLASAMTFAYAHVLYINPVAPLLSFFGGLIFAQTYQKHRSLALVTIEHGLYGNSLFLIGLGWYFYSGSVTLS